MARSLSPKRRKRRRTEFKSSLRLGLVLAGLTTVNVYVFFFRADTSVQKLMAPQSTEKSLLDQKEEALIEPGPAPLAGKGAPKGGTKADPNAVMGAPDKSAVAAGSAGGKVIEGKIGPNDTIGTVLERDGFEPVAGAVVRALTRVFDPKSIQPGDDYVLTFDDDGAPESFEYAPTPATRYIVAVGGDGTWQARKEDKPLQVKVEQVASTIESSLYESVKKANESSALVALLVDLFAWDINFYTDTHPNDHWKVVIEKQYLGGEFYKYGRVLAAEYGGRVGTFRAFYWAPNERTQGRYFDERGQAIAKSMLKTPLRFVRISSKFDRHRFHPVLHRTKAHLGIDYAAPTGTPVWASTGGKVVEAQMKPGSGNTVVINHGAGLTTRYYHLSKFAKGLKVGQTVRQKEVIGFVGSTGLSTGPHLHFAVTKNGAFVDPSKLQVTREAPASNKAAFLEAIRPRVAALKALPPVMAAAKN